MKETRWYCPNCLIECAFEIDALPENRVKCKCNNSFGKCYYDETVSETKKRLNEQKDKL